jgi:hypothetical protein
MYLQGMKMFIACILKLSEERKAGLSSWPEMVESADEEYWLGVFLLVKG